MDRSFLFDASVVAASRKFVCVRLATYEDENENRFLKSLYRTGSGELENSVFAIFSPDAKEKLARTGRGPRQLFKDATDMSAKMDGYAKRYPVKEAGSSPLPTVASIPLGLSVAAADNLPLAIVVATTEQERKSLEAKLATLAWSKEFLGQLTYAIATSADDLKSITGAKFEAGILIVQPDKFGRTAKILSQIKSEGDWLKTLRSSLGTFAKSEKSQRTHIREGRDAGVFYEPKTPVTDPMELKARERNRVKP